MSLELHDRIAIRRSFPAHGLQVGDGATLIAFVDHPGAGPRGCVLELLTAVGELYRGRDCAGAHGLAASSR